MSKVNSIYKYTKIYENTLKNLENNVLYAQSPNMFNDPYEFIFRFDVPNDYLIDFIKLIYGDGYVGFLQMKSSKKEILNYTRDYYFKEHRDVLGVACFTEDARMELLWAHYGDKHRGMCLEFDRTSEPFKQSEQVKYVNEVPVITYQDLICTEEAALSDLFTNLCLTKSDVWSYEKEWRLLTDANVFIPYGLDCVRSITFGFFCPREMKQQVIQKTAHLSIDYYEIVRAKDSYTIERALIK